MLERFSRHFQFLLKSTNQHGVHSPFVYSYLTDGIYDTKKSYKGYRKKQRLLQATIDYFQVQEIIGTPEFEIRASNINTKHSGRDSYKRLNYISNIETLNAEGLEQLAKSANEDTIIYIQIPYKCIKANENWLKLHANTRFNVSIDFYVAGILFTREEQEKEHFVLRM